MNFRPLFTLLLLLNYLLVVGANLVEHPARTIDRPFAYVHSPDCQLRNALRIGCFDDCNGEQYAVKKPGERPTLPQLLTSLKGLDSHCLPVWQMAFARPTWQRAAVRPLAAAPAMLKGHRNEPDLPPRRG